MPTTRSQLTPATCTTSPGCVAWTIWPLPMYIADVTDRAVEEQQVARLDVALADVR